MKDKPLVSVIIPVFNQGQYLHEAINSVLKQTYSNFEIIVINDGSDDEVTVETLAGLKLMFDELRIINTANRGVVHARNLGIKEARGEYILPLDADDKIGKEYLEKAVAILLADSNAGIVYAKARYFGEEKGLVKLKPFSLKGILQKNVIYSSAFFRKKDWEKIGGYKTYMDGGLEDWDLWLSILELKRNVVEIPDILFYYRIRANSRNKKVHDNPRILFSIKLQIIKHHQELYSKNFEVLVDIITDLNNHIFEREEALNDIRNSRTFKLAQEFSKIYNFVLRRKSETAEVE
jgi:glycosyltransferase involved in cell wall biosynthesis